MDKKEQKTKAKKKALKVIIIIFVWIVIISVLIFLGMQVYKHLKINNDKNKVVINSNSELKNIKGKLANYITNLGDSYYIRYTGEFGKVGLNEELVQGTLEYTQKGGETAITCDETGMRVVVDGEYAYNIVDKYKWIFKAKLPVRFETEEYNLISDFGQKYIADVETEVVGVKYIYQEYEYEGSKIRYYFVDDDLRYIRIVTDDYDRKINIRVDKHTKQELFEIPKDYKVNNM